jgi:hypothetical protein
MITLCFSTLRRKVAAVQQKFYLLRVSPLQVHPCRWLHAPVRAQPRRNEQALTVERLCKFYHSDNISGSVPVYVIQGFHTVNRTCLSCSPVSIVSRNRSGATKPQWGLNGLRYSAVVSAHRRWVIVSIFCPIFSYVMAYFRFWLPDSVSASF